MLIELCLILACPFASLFSKKPEYVKTADRVMTEFSQQHMHRYPLQLVQQTGIFDDQISALFLDYKTERVIAENEAEDMLRSLSLSFIEFVNQRQDVQRYLGTHPFTLKEISMSIQSMHHPLVEGELALAELSGGVFSLYYYKEGETSPSLGKRFACDSIR